jgi:hypothetical protein
MDHRIGSSRLNLACEGLLLGIRAEGHGDSKTEVHARALILMNLHHEMKVALHLCPFCRIKSATTKSRRRREVAPEVIPTPEASRQ